MRGLRAVSPLLALAVLASGAALVALPKGEAHDQRAVKRLIAALSKGGARERAEAARLLGEMEAKEAVPALADVLLKDESPLVRGEAAKALGRLRDGRAVGPLSKALLEDRDANVRMLSAYALGLIGDERAVEALCLALGDKNWLVREFASWALRRIGSPKAVSLLVSLLGEEGIDEEHVIWALSGLRAKKGLTKLLLPLLRSPSPKVRARAVRLLGEAGGEGALEALVRALSDESPLVRREAARALGKLGEPEATGPLKALLQREREEAVREAAREALARLEFERVGLVAWWSFDEVEEGTVKDVAGGGNDGRVEGKARLVPGRVGKALELGGDGLVDVGKPRFDVGGKELTVMAWALPGAGDGVVFVYGGAWCGLSLYVKGGRPGFGIHRVKEGPAYAVEGKEGIVGRWAHLAGVVRRDRIELYVDGKLVGWRKVPGPLPSNPGQGAQIGFDKGDSPVGLTSHFVGLIDEVKFFLKALSPKEIAEQAGLKGEG